MLMLNDFGAIISAVHYKNGQLLRFFDLIGQTQFLLVNRCMGASAYASWIHDSVFNVSIVVIAVQTIAVSMVVV